ncbi:MAG: proprotein convertase P-domain-containing protein [Phycisphaerales bacterium]|nr:proprotein convertase P-domain-containing protein [Phycisphaerales bacterium]
MSKGMMTMGVATIGLTLASAANAGFSGNGAGGSIPDSGTGVFTSDIVVGASGSLADITVSLNDLTHTWAGDLVATIEHVDTGSSITLFDRIGKTNATSGFGSSSDFDGDYSFNDAFTGDLWAAAASNPIPGGEYRTTGGLSGAATSLLAIFGGEDISGTWRLTIEDFAGGDTGALESWTLTLVPVPAPAAVALLGLGGLCGRRRRRA